MRLEDIVFFLQESNWQAFTPTDVTNQLIRGCDYKGRFYSLQNLQNTDQKSVMAFLTLLQEIGIIHPIVESSLEDKKIRAVVLTNNSFHLMRKKAPKITRNIHATLAMLQEIPIDELSTLWTAKT